MLVFYVQPTWMDTLPWDSTISRKTRPLLYFAFHWVPTISKDRHGKTWLVVKPDILGHTVSLVPHSPQGDRATRESHLFKKNSTLEVTARGVCGGCTQDRYPSIIRLKALCAHAPAARPYCVHSDPNITLNSASFAHRQRFTGLSQVTCVSTANTPPAPLCFGPQLLLPPRSRVSVVENSYGPSLLEKYPSSPGLFSFPAHLTTPRETTTSLLLCPEF